MWVPQNFMGDLFLLNPGGKVEAMTCSMQLGQVTSCPLSLASASISPPHLPHLNFIGEVNETGLPKESLKLQGSRS